MFAVSRETANIKNNKAPTTPSEKMGTALYNKTSETRLRLTGGIMGQPKSGAKRPFVSVIR
jgi:hypothetical protein